MESKRHSSTFVPMKATVRLRLFKKVLIREKSDIMAKLQLSKSSTLQEVKVAMESLRAYN